MEEWIKEVCPTTATAVISNGALLRNAQGQVGFAPRTWGVNPEHNGRREFYPLDGDGKPVFIPVQY